MTHTPLYNNMYFDISSSFWPMIYEGIRTCELYIYIGEVWYNENLSMKFLYFPEFFIIGKYEKSGFRTGEYDAIFRFLEAKWSKKIQKVGIGDCFCLLSKFHFSCVSQAKTNLHNKYMM